MSQSATQSPIQNPVQNSCQNIASTPVSARLAPSQVLQTAEEQAEENRRIRLLEQLIHVVIRCIQQDQSLSVEQASEMAAATRRTALRIFPGKAKAFDMLLWPRLQRTMRERYRMQ